MRLLLVMLVLMSVTEVPSLDQSPRQSEPTYSVIMSMPQKAIYGAHKVDITFSIVGFGNVSFGSVLVQSDSKNLLVNTFTIQSVLVGGEELIEGTKIGPAEKTETKAIFAILSVEPVSFPEGLEQVITGSIQIDTSGMSVGRYRLKAVFQFQSNGGNFSFEDSIEYEIIDFFEAYKIWSYVITAISSIVGSITVEEYIRRRGARKSRKR